MNWFTVALRLGYLAVGWLNRASKSGPVSTQDLLSLTGLLVEDFRNATGIRIEVAPGEDDK